MNRRTTILLAAVYALLAGCALESYSYMSDQRQESLEAQAGAAVCRDVAGKIKQLGRQPVLAAEQEQGQSQIDSLIEKAAGTAGVNPTDCIASIKPQVKTSVPLSLIKPSCQKII